MRVTKIAHENKSKLTLKYHRQHHGGNLHTSLKTQSRGLNARTQNSAGRIRNVLGTLVCILCSLRHKMQCFILRYRVKLIILYTHRIVHINQVTVVCNNAYHYSLRCAVLQERWPGRSSQSSLSTHRRHVWAWSHASGRGVLTEYKPTNWPATPESNTLLLLVNTVWSSVLASENSHAGKIKLKCKPQIQTDVHRQCLELLLPIKYIYMLVVQWDTKHQAERQTCNTAY